MIWMDLAHDIVTVDSSKSNLRHANYYQFKIRYARTNILKFSGIMKPLRRYISKNLNLEKNSKIIIIRILSTPKMIFLHITY